MNRAISGSFQVVSTPHFYPAQRHRHLFRADSLSPAGLRFEAISLCAENRPYEVLDARVSGAAAEQWKAIAFGMVVVATGFIRPRMDGEVCFGEPMVLTAIESARFEAKASPPPMKEFRW